MLPIATVQYTVIQREQFYFPRLHHNDWTVYIVIRGSFRCTMNGTADTLEPGDVYVIPPNTEFDRSVTEKLLVHFIRFTLHQSPLPFPIPTGKLSYTDRARAEGTVRMLKRTAKLSAEQQEWSIRHCLSDLLIQYHLEKQCPEVRPAPEDETVRDVQQYMEENFQEQLRLADVAARFHVSPSGLIKKFRKAAGILPQRYLIELRVRQAKRYLTDTAMNVSEIAEKTGFESVYYFSKFFKRETGVSPTEYRNQYRI